MFLHGSWMHLLSNMAFLWVFGDNVEDAMGHVKFLLFYLLCGAAAGLAHAWMSPASPAPLIGASGAIAGVIAAYLMLYPHIKVWILVLWRLPLRLPAMVVLGFWIVVQIISVATSSGSRTAWWAHLGGFAAGMILIPLFKHRSIRLLSRPKRD
jgi:membrane associated rhomboid family serine protease